MIYKYDIFISHSSQDKEIVRQLSKKLSAKGFSVWLDEWEIKVGDQIIQKISDGVETSRFLAIWLTQNSVKSKWVQEEWQAKYFTNITSSNTVLLPLLGEMCKIPTMLISKKYADFTISFEDGLSSLVEVLNNNSTQIIKQCFHSLIEGNEDSPESAKKLGMMALYNCDEVALKALWESTILTKKPLTIIDHIAYYFSRIMIEGTDPKIRKLGVAILKKSIKNASEIVIDKYAYAAGDIVLESNDRDLKIEILVVIKETIKNGSKIAKECYLITKRRMESINNNIFIDN